jgi:hypothetical protein
MAWFARVKITAAPMRDIARKWVRGETGKLEQQVPALLEENPEPPWDEAVAQIAGGAE